MRFAHRLDRLTLDIRPPCTLRSYHHIAVLVLRIRHTARSCSDIVVSLHVQAKCAGRARNLRAVKKVRSSRLQILARQQQPLHLKRGECGSEDRQHVSIAGESEVTRSASKDNARRVNSSNNDRRQQTNNLTQHHRRCQKILGVRKVQTAGEEASTSEVVATAQGWGQEWRRRASLIAVRASHPQPLTRRGR
jgi:hypothetical protein